MVTFECLAIINKHERVAIKLTVDKGVISVLGPYSSHAQRYKAVPTQKAIHRIKNCIYIIRRGFIFCGVDQVMIEKIKDSPNARMHINAWPAHEEHLVIELPRRNAEVVYKLWCLPDEKRGPGIIRGLFRFRGHNTDN